MPAQDLPADVLYRTFELALPTSLPKVVHYQTDAAKFFSSTAPYNLALTCRFWRNVVLSTPSLWSSLYFSFDFPSTRDLFALKVTIERHIRRAGSAPLTCFLNLSSRCDPSLAFEIVFCLLERQKRWKRIGLYVDPLIASKITLIVEDLTLLEELHIDHIAEYHVDTYLTHACVLSSLTHLDLEVEISQIGDYTALDWLQLTPNLQELLIVNRSTHPLPSVIFPSSHIAKPIPGFFPLPALRTLRAGSYRVMKETLPSTSVHAPTSSRIVASVLKHLTCPTLTAIYLEITYFDSDNMLFNFLQRSAPPLEIIHISMGRSMNIERIVIDAFGLVPSVRELRFELLGGDNRLGIGIFFESLARAQEILPALEHLELENITALPKQYMDLITARWRSEHRTLKTVILQNCYFPVPWGEREALQNFEYGDDLKNLPASLVFLRRFVEEGLQFSTRTRSYTRV